MKKINLVLSLVLISTLLTSCFPKEAVDVKESIQMTIHPDTGYAGYFMSDNVYGEFLLFSVNGSQDKVILTNGEASFNNFQYEKGYEYLIEAKKITLADPPQDGSSIIYEYVKTISKKKSVIQNSEQQIEMDIAPSKVDVILRSSEELKQAFLIKEKGEVNMKPLIDIENFNFEEGTTYKLNVKKVVNAEPYGVKYILIDILSQQKQ